MCTQVRVDLHVHSSLSPCAGEEMAPPQVLLTAERRSVKVLGVVDHCTARNAWAFLEAAQAFDVRVFVGLEVESVEGVHILALFDTVETVMHMDAVVAEHLPGLLNQPDILGPQSLMDEWGNVTGHDGRLLATATDLSVNEIARITGELGGMSIPAHIDRSLYGLLPTLGFIPPDLRVDAFELSGLMSPEQARARWPQLANVPLVKSSDAHDLGGIASQFTWVSSSLARAPLGPREWARALARELCGHSGGDDA